MDRRPKLCAEKLGACGRELDSLLHFYSTARHILPFLFSYSIQVIYFTMLPSPPAAATKKRKAGLSYMVIAAAAVGIRQVSAIPCAAYDGTGQVGYVFGAPYGDLSLGPDLSNPSAFVSLTNKTGRPDFSGSNTQCFVVSPARTDCSQRSLMIWLLLLPR